MSLFVDKVSIRCKAGDGGNGCVSFHREKFVQAGGPDGGDGGRGGDIVFVASERMHTLMDFRFKRNFAAPNGEDGSGNRCKGKSGEALVIEAPVGTIVREKASGRVLLDLFRAGERRVLQRGGNGGFGNMHFATPTRQAPNFAKPGGKCTPREFILELKTIADVGLVGFPNVGKSTLLSRVTAAKPKIADYHFTTLTPNLGICSHRGTDFVLADIPGIVEGASEGVGLGLDFLRHVERTRLLVHVIDASGIEGRIPTEDWETLNREMEKYGNLSQKPQIIAANKCDLPDAEEGLRMLRETIEGAEIYPISAATGQGIDRLLDAVTNALASLPQSEPFAEEELLPDALAGRSGYEVTVEDGVFVVSGPGAEQLINSVNFDDEESVAWFHRTMRRAGIIDSLRELGAKDGSTVSMDGMEFDFID